jgi:hypothetical protein
VNTRALAAMLLKVWGLLYIVDSALVLANIPFYTSMAPGEEDMRRLAVIYTAGASAAGVIAGFALIALADRVSRRLVPEELATPSVAPAHGALLEVAVAALGLYFLVEGVADAAPLAYGLLQTGAHELGTGLGPGWMMWQDVPKIVIRIAAGLTLLLGRRRIIAWLT